MKRRLLMALLISVLSACGGSAATHQDSPREQPLTGTVDWQAVGIKLTLPQGWQGSLDPSGIGLVLNETAADPRAIMVYPDIKNIQDASREMTEALQIGTHTFQPVAQPMVGPLYAQNWFKAESGLYATLLYRTGSLGVHASFLAVTPKPQELDSILVEIINKIKFTPPAPSPYTKTLSGAVMRKQSNSSNYDEYDEVSLCKDGSYSRVFALNSSGSGSLTTSSQGSWLILSSTLFLYDAVRGESTTLPLGTEEGFHPVGQARCS